MPSLSEYWRNEYGIARQCPLPAMESGQPEQDQRKCCGRGLNVQDPSAYGDSAIDAGDDHAEQKEGFDLERKARDALNEPPDEAGGEEAVIEALIGREHGGLCRLLGRVAKGFQAQRLGPEEHL